MTSLTGRIDLHMHTTVSDGTDSPEGILDKVRSAGLALFSVTDHDAVKGCRIIQALLTPDDPAFLTGVEFSCKDEEGKYHILGYGFDPEAEPICRVVEKGHNAEENQVSSTSSSRWMFLLWQCAHSVASSRDTVISPQSSQYQAGI